ncbi:MAG TPA: hypothetical protein VH599_05180 [Ktedonobacterales bacterium]|jgi:hypothetical protein
MEQDITGMSDASDLPEHLPNDKEEPGSAELAADLAREQAAGRIPPGSATPGQGEDAILFVETGRLPDQESALSPEDAILGTADLEAGSPWYRSRWLYLGASLAGGIALAVGAALLIRNRNARRRRTALWRAQNFLNQWSNQLSGQTGRLTEQVSRFTGQIGKPTRRAGRVRRRADMITRQAQNQLSRLASRTQGVPLSRMPRQRQKTITKWLKQTRRQLTNLSRQAGGQMGSFGDALSSVRSSLRRTTRATTAQAIGKTQESLAQVRQGVASGAARTGKGIKSGWKFSRNFTLGMTAGAVWAALFTPQSGEATRQRLTAFFPSRRPRNQ